MPTATIDKATGEYLGTGRRKTAVARVRLRRGSGAITINGRTLDDYFDYVKERNAVVAPLRLTGTHGSLDIVAAVRGGGPVGQAAAILLGIARALKNYNPEFDHALREAGMLTRDARKKERKKYGLHGARRGTQFSKR